MAFSTLPPDSSIPTSNSPTTSGTSTATLPFFDSYNDLTIRFLKAVNAKPVEGARHCFEIGDDGFAAAFSRLKQSDPVTFAAVSDGKLRLDIFEDTLLVLKMPEGGKHGVATVQLVDLIFKHLKAVRVKYPEGSCTWKFLKDIKRVGTGAIPLFNRSLVQPDEAFQVDNGVFPAVILETADSQRFNGKGGLDYKMHTMITGSGGRIKTVIAIELKSRRPRLSMHIAQVEFDHDCEGCVDRKVILNRVYLDSGGSLELDINSFASGELIRTSYPGLDQAAKVSIPFQDILNGLACSIAIYQNRKDFRKLNVKPRWTWKRFTSTPAPGLRLPQFAKSPLSKSYNTTSLKLTTGPNRFFSTAHFNDISQLQPCIPIIYQPAKLAIAIKEHTTLRHPLQWSGFGRSLSSICRFLR